MRKLFLTAVVVLALLAPGMARADGAGLIGGAVLGGLAGSIYGSGLAVTATAVGSAAASTVSAIGAAVPILAYGAAGAIGAASGASGNFWVAGSLCAANAAADLWIDAKMTCQ